VPVRHGSSDLVGVQAGRHWGGEDEWNTWNRAGLEEEEEEEET